MRITAGSHVVVVVEVVVVVVEIVVEDVVEGPVRIAEGRKEPRETD